VSLEGNVLLCDAGEQRDEMVGAAKTAQTEDQVYPVVVHEQMFEIDTGERQFGIGDQAAERSGEAGAETQRDIVIAVACDQLTEVHKVQPPEAAVDGQEDAQRRIERLLASALDELPLEKGQRRGRSCAHGTAVPKRSVKRVLKRPARGTRP